MLVIIDPQSSETIHEQIVAQLRAAIRRGGVGQGERLPAARRLAESLDVNVHTVLKAYQELRDAGLIDMRRGRGATVIASPSTAEVADLVRDLLEAGRRAGLTLTEIHDALDEGAKP